MTNETRNYWKSINGELSFMGHASRGHEFFTDPRIYYFTELSIPSDAGRVRDVKNNHVPNLRELGSRKGRRGIEYEGVDKEELGDY